MCVCVCVYVCVCVCVCVPEKTSSQIRFRRLSQKIILTFILKTQGTTD